MFLVTNLMPPQMFQIKRPFKTGRLYALSHGKPLNIMHTRAGRFGFHWLFNTIKKTQTAKCWLLLSWGYYCCGNADNTIIFMALGSVLFTADRYHLIINYWTTDVSILILVLITLHQDVFFLKLNTTVYLTVKITAHAERWMTKRKKKHHHKCCLKLPHSSTRRKRSQKV